MIKSGMRNIKSCKFIDGRQSSSFLGMICISKSLPSAKEGNVNYDHLVKLARAYLSFSYYEGRLEGELFSEQDFKVELCY